MKAKVIQFRRGRKTVTEKHFILDVGTKTRKDASKYIGKSVESKSSSGKLFRGKISSAHGNRGLVRAIFEKGLPGQSLGTEIEVREAR